MKGVDTLLTTVVVVVVVVAVVTRNQAKMTTPRWCHVLG